MQLGIQLAKQFSTLYESVAAQDRSLREMLAGHYLSGDIKLEVEHLNGLLSLFTCANELMQQALDCPNAKVKRERVRAALEILRRHGIIEGSEPLIELRDLSNRTICRTLELLDQAGLAMALAADVESLYVAHPSRKLR